MRRSRQRKVRAQRAGGSSVSKKAPRVPMDSSQHGGEASLDLGREWRRSGVRGKFRITSFSCIRLYIYIYIYIYAEKSKYADGPTHIHNGFIENRYTEECVTLNVADQKSFIFYKAS